MDEQGTVVRDRQQLVMAQRRPVPAYSRLVMVGSIGLVGVADNYSWIGGFGDRVWLLGLKFWYDHVAAAAPYSVAMYPFTSLTAPGSAAEALECEPVIRYAGVAGQGLITGCDFSREYRFRLQQLFEGNRRVFGVWVRNTGAGTVVAHAVFEVSEG